MSERTTIQSMIRIPGVRPIVIRPAVLRLPRPTATVAGDDTPPLAA